MPNRPLVVVVGPTASGKSALAMQIAHKYDGEIIAADSRTIYRGLDIGTAKPTSQDRQKIPHHLLDLRNPDESFNAAEFQKLANAAIEDIQKRGKLPILVGGTGLYIDAVIFDYTFGTPADPIQRAHLQTLSVDQLRRMCSNMNITLPINNHNKRHLIRAIEMDGLRSEKKRLRPDTLVVGLSTSRAVLRQRIEQRTDHMIEQGVLAEVAAVGARYHWEGEALKANIYRVFKGVSEGIKSLDQARTEFIASDMSLAKRQMTWFRRNPHIRWAESSEALLLVIDDFLRDH